MQGTKIIVQPAVLIPYQQGSLFRRSLGCDLHTGVCLNPLSAGKSVQTEEKMDADGTVRLNPLSTGKSVQTNLTQHNATPEQS